MNSQKEILDSKHWWKEHYKISCVLDKNTGELLNADDVLVGNAIEIIQLRKSVVMDNYDNPRFLCPKCGEPLKISSTKEKASFYFSHVPKLPHLLPTGEICDWYEPSALSELEIRMYRYDKKKESPIHQLTKNILERSLQSDTNFSETRQERHFGVYRQMETGQKYFWRKPDIQTTHQIYGKMAFEIQHSSTFLEVIAERTRFYLQENSLLFWIFTSFDLNDSQRKITQNDIFYNNNCNAFVANAETLKCSIEQNELSLLCHYFEPVITNTLEIDLKQRINFIKFSDLTVDIEKNRIYYFDFEEALQIAKEDLVAVKKRWAIAEEKRIAQEKLMAEKRRLAEIEERRIAEEKRIAQEKQIAEKRRLAEIEERRIAEERRVAEEEELAEKQEVIKICEAERRKLKEAQEKRFQDTFGNMDISCSSPKRRRAHKTKKVDAKKRNELIKKLTGYK
jgi:competence CoiA-like predicted nuclease